MLLANKNADNQSQATDYITVTKWLKIYLLFIGRVKRWLNKPG